MSAVFRKLASIWAGLLMAAGIAYYPWTYLDKFTGAASSAYGMSAVIWAPAALVLGIAAGAACAKALWPRKPGASAPSGREQGRDGDSSFEA